MNEEKIDAVLLKCDVVEGSKLPQEAFPLIHDAVEYSLTGYEVERGWPIWGGDGASAYFLGSDAPLRAVKAALDIIERVRTIGAFAVQIRVSIGIGEVPADTEISKISPPDFNLAGHFVGSDVCPPNAVCLTEDIYFSILGTASELTDKFAYLGTTTRDGAAVFIYPANKRPTKEGGLQPPASDHFQTTLKLRGFYPRPPFSNLRFYALPQFNFVGSLDLMRVFTPLSVCRHRSIPFLPSSEISPEKENDFLSGFGEAASEPFREVFNRHRSLVILGDPGSGKTTLLRYLAIVTTGGRYATQERLGVAERLLPLYLSAASLLAMRREFENDSLQMIIARLIGRDIGCAYEAVEEAIKKTAELGEALFLIDGLDEMPEANDRLTVAKLIETLAADFPSSRFIVTSRLVGYPGVSLPAGEEYRLEPLAIEQTQVLARSFYIEFYRAQRYEEAVAIREGTQKGDRLLDALRERSSMTLFAQNPLLLSLAALVHIQLGELPRYRVKLYDIAIQTLVEAWAKARHPIVAGSGVSPVDYQTEGRTVLPALAYYIHEKVPGGILSEGDLVTQIVSLLPNRQGDMFAEEAKARDFLKRLNYAGSLLVERGPGQWGFMHQTFQEYLAAKFLVQNDQHGEMIGPRLYHSRWREVTRFIAGELGIVQGRSKAAASFIRAIMDDKFKFSSQVQITNIILATECMIDTICHDTTLEDELVSVLEALRQDQLLTVRMVATHLLWMINDRVEL